MAQLPLPDAYRAAISNPHVSFGDPELKSGGVAKTPLGLPSVWSGQFAAVFRLQTTKGQKAVRCFTSTITDQQDRYAKLYQHISSKSLPMLVNFEYQSTGIRVNGAWYPIVKMEWVDGMPLDRQVEEWISSRDTSKLIATANQWLDLSIGLQQAQIAHGDLQHDNVLVSNGYIRLVDYDGIFVPGLAGRSALEIGHMHYQHPKRMASDFNIDLDNFSVLVIYLSMRALAVDPGLWSRFHKDKHLILLAKDFEKPQQSLAIATLKKSPDSEVRGLTSELERLCRGPLSAVPPLTSVLKLQQANLRDWRQSCWLTDFSFWRV